MKRNPDTAVVIRTGAALNVRIFVFLRLFTAKRFSGVNKRGKSMVYIDCCMYAFLAYI